MEPITKVEITSLDRSSRFPDELSDVTHRAACQSSEKLLPFGVDRDRHLRRKFEPLDLLFESNQEVQASESQSQRSILLRVVHQAQSANR